jgi:hypothetical protein
MDSTRSWQSQEAVFAMILTRKADTIHFAAYSNTHEPPSPSRTRRPCSFRSRHVPRGFVPIETLAMGRKDYDPAAEVVKVLAAMRAAIAELK